MPTDTDSRPAAAPADPVALVVDLRDRTPAPSLPATDPRRARLARLQAADVRHAARLHAELLGRRRPRTWSELAPTSG